MHSIKFLSFRIILIFITFTVVSCSDTNDNSLSYTSAEIASFDSSPNKQKAECNENDIAWMQESATTSTAEEIAFAAKLAAGVEVDLKKFKLPIEGASIDGNVSPQYKNTINEISIKNREFTREFVEAVRNYHIVVCALERQIRDGILNQKNSEKAQEMLLNATNIFLERLSNIKSKQVSTKDDYISIFRLAMQIPSKFPIPKFDDIACPPPIKPGTQITKEMAEQQLTNEQKAAEKFYANISSNDLEAIKNNINNYANKELGLKPFDNNLKENKHTLDAIIAISSHFINQLDNNDKKTIFALGTSTALANIHLVNYVKISLDTEVAKSDPSRRDCQMYYFGSAYDNNLRTLQSNLTRLDWVDAKKYAPPSIVVLQNINRYQAPGPIHFDLIPEIERLISKKFG